MLELAHPSENWDEIWVWVLKKDQPLLFWVGHS